MVCPCQYTTGFDTPCDTKCPNCERCLRCGSQNFPHDCLKNGPKGYCGLSSTEDINEIVLVDYKLCGQPGAQGLQSKAEIKNFYWEDENIILELKTGEKYVLKNPYISNISFEGLDYEKTDTVDFELKMTFKKG